MPHRFVAVTVGVRIAGQDVRRNILREIPLGFAIVQGQIHRRVIAGVVAIARIDDQRNDIASHHVHVLKRSHRDHCRALAFTGGEHLSRLAAPQFQRIGDAVATHRVPVLNFAAYSQRAGDRTAPRDDRCELRRGMCGNAVRRHRARNFHRGIGGVRQHAESIVAGPAFDELIGRRALRFLHEQRFQFHFARSANAEIVQPTREHFAIDVVLLRKREEVRTAIRTRRLVRRRETSHHAFCHCIAVSHHLLHDRAHIAQEQFAMSRRVESRFFPEGKIVRVSIPRIAGGEIQREIAAVRWRLQLHPQLMLRRERCHRFQPGLRAADFTQMSNIGEAPKRLLPSFDVSHCQTAFAPFRAQRIEQRRGFVVLQHGP